MPKAGVLSRPRLPPGFWIDESTMRSAAPAVWWTTPLEGSSLRSTRCIAAGATLWDEPISIVYTRFDAKGHSPCEMASDFESMLRVCPAVVATALLRSPGPPNAAEHPMEEWLEAFDALQRQQTGWCRYLWRRHHSSASSEDRVHWASESSCPLPAPNCRGALLSYALPPTRRGEIACPSTFGRRPSTTAMGIASATLKAFAELLKRFHVPHPPELFDVHEAALLLDVVRRRGVLLCEGCIEFPGCLKAESSWRVGGVLRYLGQSDRVSLRAASNASCQVYFDDIRSELRVRCVASEDLQLGEPIRVFVPSEGLLSLADNDLVQRLNQDMKPQKIRALEVLHGMTLKPL